MTAASRWTIFLALLVAFTALRIATTYRGFSQTSDEPWHLAAGYDFLKSGRQTSDLQHPPLARIFFALPSDKREIRRRGGGEQLRAMPVRRAVSVDQSIAASAGALIQIRILMVKNEFR